VYIVLLANTKLQQIFEKPLFYWDFLRVGNFSNVEQKDLYGEASITAEHVQNNRSVRGMLGQRGIKPEELPPAEDIKKVERRVAKDEKSMQKDTSKLPKK
jgi:hypothetical protein